LYDEEKKLFVGDWGRSETRTLLQHQSQSAVKRPRIFKPPQAGGKIESIFSHRVLCEWEGSGRNIEGGRVKAAIHTQKTIKRREKKEVVLAIPSFPRLLQENRSRQEQGILDQYHTVRACV